MVLSAGDRTLVHGRRYGPVVFLSDACLTAPEMSVLAFLEHWATGRSNERHIRDRVAAARSELARGTDHGAVTASLLELLGGATADDLACAARRWLHGSAAGPEGRAAPPVTPCLRRELVGHRDRDAGVVLVSDLFWPLPEELRAAVGADTVLCPGPDAERCDAAVASTRVQVVRQFARSHGVDLATSYAYGAVAADIPVLRAVGRPVVVGDQPTLIAEAALAGWTVLA